MVCVDALTGTDILCSTDCIRAMDCAYWTELLHSRRSGYRLRPLVKSTMILMLRMNAHLPSFRSCRTGAGIRGGAGAERRLWTCLRSAAPLDIAPVDDHGVKVLTEGRPQHDGLREVGRARQWQRNAIR